MVTKIEGIAPASASWAKKHILGFSDEDIKLDLQQQRIQTAIAKEIELTPEVIKHTGFFDQLDKLYGVKPSGSTDTTATETESSSESGLGGDFGGGFEARVELVDPAAAEFLAACGGSQEPSEEAEQRAAHG
jgi:hypothetical protein